LTQKSTVETTFAFDKKLNLDIKERAWETLYVDAKKMKNKKSNCTRE